MPTSYLFADDNSLVKEAPGPTDAPPYGGARPPAARPRRSSRCAPSCLAAADPWSPRSSTRCPATPTRSAGRWARPSATRCSSRWAASSPWPAAAAAPTRHPDRPGGRGRLPARPRRGPQRPLDRGAARGVPDRRPGVLARDVDDRGAQRGRRREAGRPSPSWCSPTSTSCPRPASPATPTSSRPPAGCASDCSSGWPTTCSRRAGRRGASRPPSGPGGSRRRP